MILLAKLEKGMDRLFHPLGLLYVANALEQKGKNVEIFHEHDTQENISALVDKVKKEKPRWIGFSANTGPSLISTIEASKQIKSKTDTQVIWGGSHPTIIEGVEKESYVDKVIRGEGEVWVTGKPVTDMDSFQPSWHLINPRRYDSTILYLVTSRGCPYRCGFCYSPAVWKRKWKCHSVDKVLEIINSYPIKPAVIEFRDDYFFADKKRVTKLISYLKGFLWMSTIRAHDLTSELLDNLKILPWKLSVGIESGSQRLLDFIHKDITLTDVNNALEVAEKYGINLYVTFIINLPTETDEEKEITIRMAKNIQKEYKNVECSIKKYRCYPGTELFQFAVRNGWKPPTNTEEWAKYAMEVWK